MPDEVGDAGEAPALVADEVRQALVELERLFRPGAQLTFIARRPGEPDQDFIVTGDDDLAELEALVRRRRQRGNEW